MRLVSLGLLLACVGCQGSATPAPVTPGGPTARTPGPTAGPSDRRAASSGLAQADRVEFPFYTNWAKFPVNTTVVLNAETVGAGEPRRELTRYRLASLDESVAVVEVRYDGSRADEPSELKFTRWMMRPTGDAAKFPGAPEGTYAEGSETLTVGGKEYACKWYKSKGRVEAGPTETQTWYCEDVPGRVVKSVHCVVPVNHVIDTRLEEVIRP